MTCESQAIYGLPGSVDWAVGGELGHDQEVGLEWVVLALASTRLETVFVRDY
jgi:hypothetical protein